MLGVSSSDISLWTFLAGRLTPPTACGILRLSPQDMRVVPVQREAFASFLRMARDGVPAVSIRTKRRSAMVISKTRVFAFCAGVMVIVLSGCGEQQRAERAVQQVDKATEGVKKVEGAGDPEAGKKTYGLLCASCHGNSGKGDGPAAATLPQKPTDHTDGKHMNTLTDQFLFDIVKQGGAGVGKSPLMPPWGNQLSDQDIRNVVSYIRTLALPPYTASQ